MEQPGGDPLEAGSFDGGSFRRDSVVRVAVLLVALVVVTAGGIVAARSLDSGPTAVVAVVTATTGAAVTTTPAASTGGRPAPPHAAGSRGWGPLPVRVSGTFAPGGAQAGAALTGQTLVVVGGQSEHRVLRGPADGRLVHAASLAGPLTAPQVFAIGQTVYVVGGEAGSVPTDQILRLDPGAHALVGAGTFEESLAEAGVAARGGSAYLVGGWNGTQAATAVLRFTPPNTVDLLARLPAGVRSPAVLLLRHTLYVAGGLGETGASPNVYAVDIDSGAVTALGKLPQPVDRAVLVLHGIRLYLLGGRTASGEPSHMVVSIDPATGQPASAGRMLHDLVGADAAPTPAGALVVDPTSGKVFAVG